MIVGTLRQGMNSGRILLDWPVRIVCFAYLIGFANLGDRIDETFSQILLVLVTLKYLFKGRTGSLDFALTIGLFYLFVMPCISLAFYGHYRFVFLVALSVLVFDLFVALCGSSDSAIKIQMPGTPQITEIDLLLWSLLILAMFAGGAILPGDGLARQLSFNTPFACSLILFEKVCRVGRLSTIYRMIAIYIAAVLFYMAFYWSGFGRIVIGSYVLLPLLIAHYWRDIGLRVWPLILIAPPMIYYANAARHGGGASLQNLHEGSVTSHMALAREFLDSISLRAPWGWDDYWGQMSLLFLQWVPRALWPDKPLGIGRLYVESGAAQFYKSEGHSIATGYAGELWLYLGSEAWLGGLITLFTLILLRQAVRQAAIGYVAPFIAFEVFLISYIWGGMASFGGRMAFMVLPMLLFLHLRRINASGSGANASRRI